MSSIYIRPAEVARMAEDQRRYDQIKRVEMVNDMSHTNHAHSPEAVDAAKEWVKPASILAIPTNADYFAWGYDCARLLAVKNGTE